MSNVFRAKWKKREKKEKTSKTPVKESSKRKALSISTPPEPNQLNHQIVPRKSSLGTDSPVHSSRTPTSPLVIAKSLSTASLATRRDSTPGNMASSAMSTSNLNLPRVSVSVDEAPMLDRQGIIDITVDVHNFLAAVSRLKKAMEEADVMDSEFPPASPGGPLSQQSSTEQEPSTAVLANLSELVQVVQTALGQHVGMQSTDIIDAAKNLQLCYQECDHTSASTCSSCNNAVDTLIDAFTNSVQEYLTGESTQHEDSAAATPSSSSSSSSQPHRRLERGGLSTNMLKGFSKSHENLSSRYSSYIDLTQQFNEPIVDQIDQALMGIENSVDVATRYLKVRTKYHREITNYFTNRAKIEARHLQQMTKLAKHTLDSVKDLAQDENLPLVDLLCSSVEQDLRFVSNCNKTYNKQVAARLIEPLEQKVAESEKVRKDLSQTWSKEQKKLNEAKTAMKSAKSRYRFLGHDLSRVKNLLAADPYGRQAEKRKKEVTDLEVKWQEAETGYKSAVAECNDCQYQVHVAAQKSILCAFRRMVIDSDMQLQQGLENYFKLQHNFFTTLPAPMSRNLEDVREYEIGKEFMTYIEGQPTQSVEPEDYLFEEFDPDTDGLMEDGLLQPDSARLPNSVESPLPTSSAVPEEVLRRGRASSPQLTAHTWDGSSPSSSSTSSHPHLPTSTPSPGTVPLNDAGSRLGSLNASHSPRSSKKRARPKSTAYLLEPTQNFELLKDNVQRRNSDQTRPKGEASGTTSPPHDPLMSRNAKTHSFKKLRGPARCRECDTYVYFHGHECETCGLACHKKCLETLAIRCGSKRLARKMNTFGVDFHKHLKATKRYIPIIVSKCINEIEDRGLDTQGLYRISPTKTKLEHLCQLFESGADRVDLSDRSPALIGSCLKLYFRQLPEPLLTFGLYQEFITFAREASHVLPCHNLATASAEVQEQAEPMLDRLRGLLQRLPYENYITLARLLYHLHHVSSPEHVKKNFMPSSNLGIVFGPNLLRQREMVASLALLADMTAQAKAIDILICHVKDVIHVSEDTILDEVEQEYDDSDTKEVSVDEPCEPIRSPQLDIDDVMTTSSRTPYNTPPERRRENVYELGEVLEALQSVSLSYRRTSQPSLLKLPLGEVRDSPHFNSLPSLPPLGTPPPPSTSPSHTEDPHTHTSHPSTTTSTSSTTSHPPQPSHSRGYLRPSSLTTPIEKMLTPVEETPVIESEDDENDIISSSSNKIDSAILSRSTSGTSRVSWTLGDLEAEISGSREDNSSISILSGGLSTPPRRILNSSHSLEVDPSAICTSSAAQNQHRHGPHQTAAAAAAAANDPSSFKEGEEILSDEGDEEEEEEEEMEEEEEEEEEENGSKDAHDSSQGSDDSSTFSGWVQPLMDSVMSPSSSEGIPVRSFSESRRHDRNKKQRVTQAHYSFPNSLTSSSARYPSRKTATSQVTSSGSTQSSTRSSLSRGTTSSQGSFSEALGEEGGGGGGETTVKTSRYNKYERYARYEKSQSLDLPFVPPCKVAPEIELTVEESSTQDSNGTVTDEVTETDSLAYPHPPSSSSTSGSTQQHESESTIYENGETKTESEDTQSIESKDYPIDDKWHLLRDSNKHTDSGIEETITSDTPEVNSNNNKESSQSNHIDGGHDTTELKPLSHLDIFTSRESGLADSPDPYSVTSDGPLKAQKPNSLDHADKEDSAEEELPSSRKGSLVEIFIPEAGGPARLMPDRRKSSVDSVESSTSDTLGPPLSVVVPEYFHRRSPNTPRSLEGNTFSKYARSPIRNQSSSGLRKRSLSCEQLHTVSPPPLPMKKSRRKDSADERNQRALSESRSVMFTRDGAVGSPLHSVSPVAKLRDSSIRRGSPVHRWRARSATPVSDPVYEEPIVTKKQQQQEPVKLRRPEPRKPVPILKPALRVVKITPNSGAGMSRFDGSQMSRVAETNEQEHWLQRMSITSDENSPKRPPVPLPYEEVQVSRARMMSPEAIAKSEEVAVGGNNMKRSQSSDDILESSGSGTTLEETQPTKIGSVYVWSESSNRGSRNSSTTQRLPVTNSHKTSTPPPLPLRLSSSSSASRETVPLSPLLVDNHHLHQQQQQQLPLPTSPRGNPASPSASFSSTGSDVAPRSPKTRKRGRTPHFV